MAILSNYLRINRNEMNFKECSRKKTKITKSEEHLYFECARIKRLKQ